MSDDLNLNMELTATDAASPAIRQVQQSFAELQKQLSSFAKSIRRSFGEDFTRAISSAASVTTRFTTDATAGFTRATTAVRADVAAVNDLAAAYRAAASAQRGINQGSGRGGRGPGGGGRPPVPPHGLPDLREIRQRWSLRERSARAEVAEIQTSAKAEAQRQRAVLDGVARQWRVRQASQRDELRHIGSVRREQMAMRREVNRRVREVYQHGHHALRSVNHPAWESAGFWVTAGAAFGIEAGRHLLESAKAIDTAITRYSMMSGVSAADASKTRADALREGMKIGIDPSEIVRLQTVAIKDGLTSDVAKALPEIVNAASQVMGGTFERDADELARAVREASTVGWVKNSADARSFMNSIAGLSNFGGNSPEKMKQFLENGGIGRGKELGWSEQQTLAFGAALNGSGERSGLGSARLMAQLPEIRAQMRDRFIRAARSHENSEENRAVRSAPSVLGYRGGIREMQSAFASPEGVTDFLSRLSGLPEQLRAAIEKGYGLGPQFNSVAAEMGADHGHRYKAALARENELSSQTAENDDLSKNQKLWSGSIEFMFGQLKASVSAVQSEMGDTIKDDILAPFTGWWLNVSRALLDGGLKQDLHRAILSFINGLGFDDLTGALNALRGSIGGFDFAGFMRGVGEGLRVVIDDVKAFAHALGLVSGGGSARALGKLAAELLGLSVALRVISPLVTLIGGVASGLRALGAAASAIRLISGLGVAGEGAAGILGTGLAAGALLPISIAAIAVGTIAVALMNWDTLKGAWADSVQALKDAVAGKPHEMSPEMKGVTEGERQRGETLPDSQRLMPDQLGPSGFLPMRYEGGEDPNNWRNLLTKASYEPTDSGDVVRQATVETARGVVETRDAVDRLTTALKASVLRGADVVGSGGGGGGAQNPSAPNIRYGRQYMGRGGSVGDGPGDVGGRAEAMTGDTAQRANRAMKKLMSLGWSKEAAAAAIGNAQQESGVRSDGPLGDTARFGFGDAAAHGMFQWRDQRFRDLKAFAGKKGTNWKDFDTQLEFFDQESRKYGSGTWRNSKSVYEANTGMKRFEGYGDKSFGQRLANARQLAAGRTDGGSYAAENNGSGAGGSAGGAVDIALGMQGAGERQAQSLLGKYMHPGEWCADFVNGALEKAGLKGTGSGMADSFSRWGHHVGIGGVQKGDVIEERHGNRVGHAGLATGKVQRDGNGNITAVEMISGNYGHMVRKNWEKVGIIADLRRSNQAIVDTAAKLKAKIKTDEKVSAAPSAPDIAHRVHKAKQPEGSKVNNVTSADNSSATITNHFNISHPHGTHIAEHAARLIARSYSDQHESV